MEPKKTYSFFNPCYIRALLLLLSIQVVWSQEKDFVIPDSLKTLDYDSLYKSYRKISRDTLRSKLYLYTYLTKAGKEDNKIRIAKAYCLLSYYAVEESEKIALLDSAIAISKGLNHIDYPIVPYTFKGGYYRFKGSYKLALNNYLQALELSEKVNNGKYVYISKHNIGLIKGYIGKHQEALVLFKENFEYKKANHVTDTTRHLKSLLALAESHRYIKNLDSASIYNLEGLIISREKKPYYYSEFIVNEGINLFFKKQYHRAYDSISKGILLLDKNNPEHKRPYLLSNFYLGKLSLMQNDTLDAQKRFLSMDSIIQIEKNVVPEVREGYTFIMDFYMNKGEKEHQLEYTNKLLRFDSIIHQQRDFISERMFKEFDAPLLVKEHTENNKKLTKNNKKLNFLVLFLGIISIIISVFLYYQYTRRKRYQQQFKKLINQSKPVDITPNKSLRDIGITDDVVEDILSKLALFEKNQQFLKKNITTTTLAKAMHTNTKYLSKVINYHKDKNFTNYINDLRIKYAVEQLKENKILKQYTIQGIAEEMGFNTAESFSSAFKKSTGIKPSYFIRKLGTLKNV